MLREEYLQRFCVIDEMVTIGHSLKVGIGCRIESGCILGGNVSIGCYTHIGPNVIIGDNVVIGDHCSIGTNIDLAFNNEGASFDEHGGAVTIEHDTVLKNYVMVEPSMEPGNNTHLCDHVSVGNFAYIKERAYIQPYTIIGAYATIGESALIDCKSVLCNYTLVGAYAHLREGCKGINRCLFDNKKTYERGWHFGEFAEGTEAYLTRKKKNLKKKQEKGRKHEDD